jgi:hypothetical protein
MCLFARLCYICEYIHFFYSLQCNELNKYQSNIRDFYSIGSCIFEVSPGVLSLIPMLESHQLFGKMPTFTSEITVSCEFSFLAHS